MLAFNEAAFLCKAGTRSQLHLKPPLCSECHLCSSICSFIQRHARLFGRPRDDAEIVQLLCDETPAHKHLFNLRWNQMCEINLMLMASFSFSESVLC